MPGMKNLPMLTPEQPDMVAHAKTFRESDHFKKGHRADLFLVPLVDDAIDESMAAYAQKMHQQTWETICDITGKDPVEDVQFYHDLEMEMIMLDIGMMFDLPHIVVVVQYSLEEA